MGSTLLWSLALVLSLLLALCDVQRNLRETRSDGGGTVPVEVVGPDAGPP